MESKVSISVIIDSTINDYLEKKKTMGISKSDMVNIVLKNNLMTEDGIKDQIEFKKRELARLEEEFNEFQRKKKELIENIPDVLKNKLTEVKGILDRHPELSNLWTKLINERYNQRLSEEDLMKLIERWT